MQIITVGRNDAGQRLDKFLSKAVKGLPMSLMYKYIRTKKIKVNRARTQQSYMLCEGDEIQLFIRDEFFASPESDRGALFRVAPKLDIVYEDENIMLLNKRPGVLVHEDTAAKENTLIMHVKAYLAQKGEYDPDEELSFAPALCNRIDRNTGGIVIAAKNAEALRVMNEKIRMDLVRKTYLCAVHGVPAKREAILRGYLKKDSAQNMVDVSDTKRAGYKEIVTGYRVLCVHNGDALLEVELITGRTHQIRAHLSHIGHPLLGDGKYGINRRERERGYKFQALYAYRLAFKETGEESCLRYLEGKQFEIDRAGIWFLKDFPMGGRQ
ncbi:MAG: RluA family pseudouridine synthase [Ruminococcaceae bacterium]|nr:RluA family pseudouridine synthase [Oscillospiraceae bacterium]